MEKVTQKLQDELNRFLHDKREAICTTVGKVEHILTASGYAFVDPRTCRTVVVEVKR
jgi:predicted house-cleaning noncanonical NTP pyrophosphatase (MazG superfamily)